ncbi:MAG: HupE/UreJ family protein [Rhodospirillales bacterium]|nr:HupE/UreJ family protein [Rhodospirillales bacterium]
MRNRWLALVWGVIVLLAAQPAFAHQQAGVAGGFVSGFSHPLFGPDHLVAMVAVGLWGAQLGRPGIWVLPITFPLVMAVGGLLGVTGVPLPAVEIVIALSAIVLGLVVALRVRAPFWIAAILAGIFAIFHGYAHGQELPAAANPVAYGVGFVLATGLLHLLGIAIGTLIAWPMGERLVRACGLVIAIVGSYFLYATFGPVA